VVVAIFGDLAASGGYYIACAADRIIAQPTTITGSIGVLISSMNFRGLGDKLGVRDVTIKSGDNKDLFNPLQEMSPEQMALIQDIVDSIHQRFVGLVAQARKRPVDEIRPLADGRIFTAPAALEAGLVDELGYWREAVAEMAVLLKEPSVKVLRYEEHFSWTSFLRATAEWPQVLKSAVRPDSSFRIQFLFSP
jgi:protease-4